MSNGSYNDLFNALGFRESSNNYQAENPAGFIGRYQLGEAGLIDIGYYLKNPPYNNDWTGAWTGKNGAISKTAYLNSPQSQELAARDWFAKLWEYIGLFDLEKYLCQAVGGVGVTVSGMLAGAHLAGIDGLKNYLGSGGVTNRADPNGTLVTDYMTLFGGYETPFSDESACETPPQTAAKVTSTPTEGNSGTHLNYFLLQLSAPLTVNATVDYHTSDGTATAGQDYIATSGTARIQAGQTFVAIPVTIIGDTQPEPDETFHLVITNPQGGVFPGNTATITATHTIVNDDTSTNQVTLAGVSDYRNLTYFSDAA